MRTPTPLPRPSTSSTRSTASGAHANGFRLAAEIARGEGVLALWRGTPTNIARSVASGASQLSVNAWLKQQARTCAPRRAAPRRAAPRRAAPCASRTRELPESEAARALTDEARGIARAMPPDPSRLVPPGALSDAFCALGAGVAVVLANNPIDVVRTRLYSQRIDVPAYGGPVDCALQILRVEGAPAFYKGVLAQFLRTGPHTVGDAHRFTTRIFLCACLYMCV